MGCECKVMVVKCTLAKWSWQYANEKGPLWIDVMKGKFGEEEGGWSSCVPREGFGWGYGKH